MLAAATDPSVAHDIAGKRFVSRKRRRGAKEHAGGWDGYGRALRWRRVLAANHNSLAARGDRTP
jgi:hypothetical protein